MAEVVPVRLALARGPRWSRWIAVLAIVLSSGTDARAARVSGQVQLNGPPRSLSALRVTLRDVGSLPNTSSQEAQRTNPDTRGRFAFANVKAGIYVVQVDGPGVLSAQWGARGPELAGRALVLRSQDDVRDLSVSVIARPVLCGQVFGVDGKPLAGAALSAWVSDAAGSELAMSGAGADGATGGGNTTADAEGRYRFDNFTPGYYILGAFPPEVQDGASLSTGVVGFWKDAPDGDTATPLHLAADGAPDRCAYDVHLASRPRERDTSPLYRVAGSLAGASRTFGARRLAWVLAPLDRTQRHRPAQTIAFEPDGSFEFRGVPPGRYRLTLGPQPFRTFSGHCVPLARTEVDQELVVSSDLVDLRVRPLPVTTVRGAVEEIHSPHDIPDPRPPDERYHISLDGNGRCGGTTASLDGSFVMTDLDPGDYRIDGSVQVYGRYTAAVESNGRPATDGVIHVASGDNVVKITERFDSGAVDAKIELTSVDGISARNERNEGNEGNEGDEWVGAEENVLLLDGRDRPFDTNIGAGRGEFKGDLPPGSYVALAGTNDALTWVRWQWNDARLQSAMAQLGTSFTIEPGKITTLTLPDRTVAIQNTLAELGCPMDSR